MWIGGTFGFESISDVSSTFELGPQWGMMINNRFGAGVNILFNNTSFKNANDDKRTSWEINPYARLYFAGTKQFKLYGDAFISFGGQTDKDNNGRDDKYSTFGVGLDLGAQYWFADDFSMAASVGALSYKTNGNGDGQDVFRFGFP